MRTEGMSPATRKHAPMAGDRIDGRSTEVGACGISAAWHEFATNRALAKPLAGGMGSPRFRFTSKGYHMLFMVLSVLLATDGDELGESDCCSCLSERIGGVSKRLSMVKRCG